MVVCKQPQMGCWWPVVGRVMVRRINPLLVAPPPCQDHAPDTRYYCRRYIVRRGGACEIRCIALVAGVVRGCTLVVASYPKASIYSL